MIEANGHKAYAVSLPGVGERSSELTAETGLENHIQAVVDYILQNDLRDVILVLQMRIVTTQEAEDAMVIDTGHDLMITEPELTTEMLLKAAELH